MKNYKNAKLTLASMTLLAMVTCVVHAGGTGHGGGGGGGTNPPSNSCIWVDSSGNTHSIPCTGFGVACLPSYDSCCNVTGYSCGSGSPTGCTAAPGCGK